MLGLDKMPPSSNIQGKIGFLTSEEWQEVGNKLKTHSAKEIYEFLAPKFAAEGRPFFASYKALLAGLSYQRKIKRIKVNNRRD